LSAMASIKWGSSMASSCMKSFNIGLKNS
jgi:hypothetical protein